MSGETCPRCNHNKFWKIRRQRHRCSRCLYEWRPGPPLRLNRDQWQRLLRVYLLGCTQIEMARETGLHVQRIGRALRLLRSRMAQGLSNPFSGNSHRVPHILRSFEADGPSMTRMAILGVLCRGGQVWAGLIKEREARRLAPFIRHQIHRGSIVCFDLYQCNNGGSNHLQSGNPRRLKLNGVGKARMSQDKPTHGLDGFWAWLSKPRKGPAKKIPTRRFPLHLIEYVWRYNHRSLPIEQRVNRLMRLISRPEAREN